MKVRRIFLIQLAAFLGFFWLVLYFGLANPAFTSGTVIDAKIRADAEALKRHVLALSTMKPTRNYEEVAAMTAAEDYVRQQLESYGYQVTAQDVPSEVHTYHNLIARYGSGDGVVVVGAHYDVCGSDNPGADDNASGVAGVLELARLMSINKPYLHTPLEFVIYSLEEPPFFGGGEMGSAVHARALKASGTQVEYMLSLEMLGYYSNEAGSQHFPMPFMYGIYPHRGNFIAVVGSIGERTLARAFKKAINANSAAVEAYSINAPPQIPGVDFSDHRNYWNEGWPAVMITDTAFLRNTQYHKAGDTADRLDFAKMADVVRGIYAGLVSVAP